MLLPGCSLAASWPSSLFPGLHGCSLAAPGCPAMSVPGCSWLPLDAPWACHFAQVVLWRNGPLPTCVRVLVQRVCGGLGERSGLRGCAAAKRGLPKRSPPEAVLPRSGPLPMRCGLSDAPLSQRSSAVAVICRSGGLRKHAPAQRVLDGDRTTEIRLRVCLQTSA